MRSRILASSKEHLDSESASQCGHDLFPFPTHYYFGITWRYGIGPWLGCLEFALLQLRCIHLPLKED